MRVIGGEFRGRKLKAPPGDATRPIPDRLRESLFNILGPRVVGCVFVDAYAGSGSVGIEALSRGAERAVFIDRGHHAVEAIRANLAALGLEERARVVQRSARAELPGLAADIVFAGPPFPAVEEFPGVLQACQEKPPGLLIVQHPSKDLPMPDTSGRLKRFRVVTQGVNTLSFYQPEDTE